MAERHNGGYGQDYPEEYRGRHDDEQRERQRSGGRFRDEDEYMPRHVGGQSREDFGDMEHGRSRRFGGGGTSGGEQQRRRDPRDYEREQDYRWSGGGRSFEEPHRLFGRQGGREQQWSRDLPRDPSQAGRRYGDDSRGGFAEYEGRPYQGGYERGGSRFEPQGGGVGGFGRLGSFGGRQETAWGGGWESGEHGSTPGRHAGRGPRGYQRSDDRIREDVCDALTADPFVDATEITITVRGGDVTLEGTVDDRQAKRRAEDCVEDLSGVRQVHNRLTVQGSSGEPTQPTGSVTKSGTTSGKGTQT